MGPPLSEAQLREAASAATKLPKAFPRVWVDTVGPVDRWEANTKAVIASLRAALQQQTSPPRFPPCDERSSRATRTSSSSPFASALAWAYALDPKGAASVARHAERLDAIHRSASPSRSTPADLARLIQWADLLAEHSTTSVAPWLDRWSRPELWRARGDQPGIARALFHLYPAFEAAPARLRLAVMRLLASLTEAQIPLDSLSIITLRLLRLHVAQVESLQRIVDRFAALSAESAVIGQLIHAWYARTPAPNEWIRAVERYVARHSCTSAHLLPWCQGSDQLLDEWEYSQRRAFKPDVLLDALSALIDIAPPSGRRLAPLAGMLGVMCRIVGEPRLAGRAVASLAAAAPEPWLATSVARCVWAMSGSDPDRFGAIGARIAKALDSKSSAPVDPPDELTQLPEASLLFLGELVLHGHAQDVLSLLRSAALVVDARLPLASIVNAAERRLRDTAPVLPVECPADLARALQSLAKDEPATLYAALDQLAKAVPPRRQLEQELQRIESLIAADQDAIGKGLTRRRDSLRARLNEGWNVTPAKRSKVMEAVRARSRRVRIAAWCGALRDAHRTWMEESLGIRMAPAWLTDSLTMRCLCALTSLPAEYRSLASRILAEQAAGRWRGHLPDPANACWIERARAAGIDMDVWLHGIAPSDLTHRSLGPLRIDIERDPLEVLKIGAWFGTCLSPYEFNYFSTVVIAADANKHVVVVRTARGEPIARRIIAVDRHLRAWAFRLYAHQRDAAIDEAVQDHVARLSCACGVRDGGIAEVESLTASDWYDDEDRRDHELFARLLDEHARSPSLLDVIRQACGDEATRRNGLGWIAGDATRARMSDDPGRTGRQATLLRLTEEFAGWSNFEGVSERNIRGLLELIMGDAPPPDARTGRRPGPPLFHHLLARCRTMHLASPELARAFVWAGEPVEAMRVLRRCTGWLADDLDTIEVRAEAELALRRPRRALGTLERGVALAWSTRDAERVLERKREIEAIIGAPRRSRAADRLE